MDKQTRITETNVGNPNAEVEALEALLGDLGVPATHSEEVIEDTIGMTRLEAAVPPTGDTEEVVADPKVAAAEKKAADAAKKAADKVAADAAKAAKKVEADAAKAAKKAEAEAAKKVAAEKKAEAAAAKKAEREAAKAAKPAPVPRKFYATKVERVSDKLGAQLGDYTVLTVTDAALTGSDLAAKQQETLDIIKKAGSKVQNRMTLLIEFVAGKSSKLNEVITRALTLLKNDGHIKTGDKGNLHANLIAKPYSPAAARAMGNNTVAALRDLKLIAKGADGSYVANPESLMLIKVNGMLGL